MRPGMVVADTVPIVKVVDSIVMQCTPALSPPSRLNRIAFGTAVHFIVNLFFHATIHCHCAPSLIVLTLATWSPRENLNQHGPAHGVEGEVCAIV